jgi:lipopolysaccharide heptosyltransferase II
VLPAKLRLLKKLDRSFGPWLCRHVTPSVVPRIRRAGAPPWAAEPVAKDRIERILVIRPGGMGDAVLTFPMIRALREHYDRATIDVLGERRSVGVYGINDWVRSVYRYDTTPAALWRTLRDLRQARYQIVVDTEQYHHLSTLVANHLRPDFLCGFDTIGRGRFQTHRVRYQESGYEVYLFLGLAAALIGEPQSFDAERPWLTVHQKWRDWAAERLVASRGRRIAVIAPGASTEHKIWPRERYARVARWFVERDFYVVILGGSDTVAAAREIAADHGDHRVLDLAGRTSLPQTAGILQHATVYVSSDTGALHVAYGVGVPTVHMFGSGIMEKWAPPGSKYVVVNKGLPCSPCTRYGYTPPCPYGVACMDAITVDDVTAAAEEVLRR